MDYSTRMLGSAAPLAGCQKKVLVIFCPRAAERVEAIPSEARSNFAIHLIHAHCASAFGRPRHSERSTIQQGHLRDVSLYLNGSTLVSSSGPGLLPVLPSCTHLYRVIGTYMVLWCSQSSTHLCCPLHIRFALLPFSILVIPASIFSPLLPLSGFACLFVCMYACHRGHIWQE